MRRFKQRRFLKEVEKLLNRPTPPKETYDSSMDGIYVGATAPRTAGHFADSAISVQQGQVKRITEMVSEIIDHFVEEGGEELEARFIELELKFQELDLRLLFTDREKAERRLSVVEKRQGRVSGCRREEVSEADLERMKIQVSQWQKEQLERKRRLYKIETTVRDLGVNINDVRCRSLDIDRRNALARLNGSTDAGVKMLREIMQRLDGFETVR